MTNKPGETVAVVGAGIVGVSAALELRRAGRDVILIDREGPASGASYGNGGVLASCAMVPVTIPGLFRTGLKMAFSRSSPLFIRWSRLPMMMPWLLKYLGKANSDDVKLIAAALAPLVRDSVERHMSLARGTKAQKWIKPSDYLYLYDDRKKFESDSFAWELRAAHGFSWDELEGEQVKDYDPAVSDRFKFAVRLENHGMITDPGAYVKDLADSFVQDGGKMLEAEVTEVTHSKGVVTGLLAGEREIPCGTAVVAAGIWSEPLARRIGVKVPIESERGYHLELWEPSVCPKAPMMIASGKAVATPMDGRLRMAGLVELAGLDASASDEPVRLLEAMTRNAFPGIEWSESSSWLGHRPAPSDSIPVIGEVHGLKGAYLAFGHHHIGLTAGPATGKMIADMIAGDKADIQSPYSPIRFMDEREYIQ